MSGYYRWRQRDKQSSKQKVDRWLRERIEQVHRASGGVYGSVRIQKALAAQGEVCNRKRVVRLMRLSGLCGRCKQRRRPRTTDSQHALPIAENRLQQDFQAERPNQKWVSDFTYVPTHEGWLYLAVVIDLFSRKVVGWSMADTMAEGLVVRALQMALRLRQPAHGLLHHSDRGSQYVSHTYQTLLKTHGLVSSMSRVGNCYDNAVVESFFATLKNEVATSFYWPTRQQARSALFSYMEGFYNRRRLHSTLGYLSPDHFEQQFATQHSLSALTATNRLGGEDASPYIGLSFSTPFGG